MARTRRYYEASHHFYVSKSGAARYEVWLDAETGKWFGAVVIMSGTGEDYVTYTRRKCATQEAAEKAVARLAEQTLKKIAASLSR